MPIKQFIKEKNNWFEKYVLFTKNNKTKFIKKKIKIQSLEKN